MDFKFRLIGVLTGLVVLSACSSTSPEDYSGAPLKYVERAEKQPTFDEVEKILKTVSGTRITDTHIRNGIAGLKKGDYKLAQAAFNRALKFEPNNPNLHFLNGMTYHLRAEAGDSSQLEFASIGYQLALDNNPSSYWAAYQLGHIHFGQQKYKEAQEAFAYALLYAPKKHAILNSMAVASYYAQDLKTAISAIEKAMEISDQDPETLRSAAMIYAAAGEIERANSFLERYQSHGGDLQGFRASRLDKRIQDWKEFHEREDYFQLAQSTSDIFGGSEVQKGLTAKSKISTTKSTAKDAKGKDAEIPTRMALVDVVIIRSEEIRASSKGVNLLSGLSATLGGTTFSFNDTRTITKDAANSRVKTFTYNPTLSLAANYSLNIFNDNYDRNEVLARPSLVALDGKKSEFFTGAVFHVELSGSAGSEGAVQDVPVGIKLDVTPKFIDQDTVEINVEAARAFIEGRSSQVGFNNFAQITKTLVTANVTLDFGETIVLSGLSEKENERLNDGVPFLQDVPVVQYGFSHEDTLDYTKSVLILMTPREPRFTYSDGTDVVDRAAEINKAKDQPNLEELSARPDWFKPAANLDSVFFHLKDGDLFKEFRSGDVRLEGWMDEGNIGERIMTTLEFLYF